MPDLHELWYAQERGDVGQWLAEHGWRVSVTNSNDVLAHYGRSAARNAFAAAPGVDVVAPTAWCSRHALHRR